MWIEIGEVTGSAGSSDGGQLNGVSYDHIIPVEIETPGGLRELKLGYNETESHFSAAQRFIDENVLDQGYIRQIADFIAARTGKASQPTFDLTTPSSSHPSPTPASSAAPVRQPQPPQFKSFPSPLYFLFDDVPSMSQLRKLVNKVMEFNDSLSEASLKLSPLELESLDELVRLVGETSYYHSSVIAPSHLTGLVKMVQSWDEDKLLFPAFDLLRMVCLHPSGASTLSSSKHLPLVIKRAVNLLALEASQPASVGTPHALLSLRFLANLFKVQGLRAASLTILLQEFSRGQLMDLLPAYLTAAKKTHRSASLLLLCNLLFSAFNRQVSQPLASQAQAVGPFYPLLLLALRQETESLDSILKGLTALGTVILSRDAAPHWTESDARSLVQFLREVWGGREAVVTECLGEVEKALDSASIY
jgi:phospholipase A-2-activating protein